MSRFKLISIIALLAGPFILVMNHQETTEKKKIDQEGIETVAIPVSKIERRGRRGGKTFKLEVEYPVGDAGSRIATVDVSRELYERIESEPILTVKYLKESPEKLVVVGEPLEQPEMNIVGVGALALGVVGSWWNFGRRKSATVPPPLPGA
ncbi:MAG: hypothetical protein ACO1QR_13690 [Chthoniobacteraceae bacterium]